MPNALKEDDLTAIERVIRSHPGAISLAEIAAAPGAWLAVCRVRGKSK